MVVVLVGCVTVSCVVVVVVVAVGAGSVVVTHEVRNAALIAARMELKMVSGFIVVSFTVEFGANAFGRCIKLRFRVSDRAVAICYAATGRRYPKNSRSLMICTTSGGTIRSQLASPACSLARTAGG